MNYANLAVSLNRYECTYSDPLGAGQYGTAFKARDTITGQYVAIKVLKYRLKPEDQTNFLREFSILAGNRHPGTLSLLGYIFSGDVSPAADRPALITPLMNTVTLADLLDIEYGRPNAKSALVPRDRIPTIKSKCVFGLAHAMAYVHSRKVLHRDLKPANIFFDHDFNPVIADFGFSKRFSNIHQTAEIGTPLYEAPERFDPPGGTYRYAFPVDVYSYGMIVYMMFVRKRDPTFANGEPSTGPEFKLYRLVSEGIRYVKLPEIPDFYWNLITRCWDKGEKLRPTFPEIVRALLASKAFLFPGANEAEVDAYIQSLDEAVAAATARDRRPEDVEYDRDLERSMGLADGPKTDGAPVGDMSMSWQSTRPRMKRGTQESQC
jgi:serine/threonine protein kinase